MLTAETNVLELGRSRSRMRRATPVWLLDVALAGAAAALAAVVAGEPALARLRRLGGCLGLGFQIADDLLDRGRDEASSLVRVLGEDAARRRAEALLAEALAQVEGWGERAEPLRELARFSVRRER